MKNVLLALTILLVAANCTVTRHLVRSNTPGFSETGKQDSGFLGFDKQGNGIITSGKRAEYNALIGKYGLRFDIPPTPDSGICQGATNGTYLISPEALVRFLEMKRWYRQESH